MFEDGADAVSIIQVQTICGSGHLGWRYRLDVLVEWTIEPSDVAVLEPVSAEERRSFRSAKKSVCAHMDVVESCGSAN